MLENGGGQSGGRAFKTLTREELSRKCTRLANKSVYVCRLGDMTVEAGETVEKGQPNEVKSAKYKYRLSI